jgi:hypothetical protein
MSFLLIHSSCFAGKNQSKFYFDGIEKLIGRYCVNDRYLAAINKTKDECIVLLTKYANKCSDKAILMDSLSVHIPENRDLFEFSKNLAYLYVTCIKSHVYEEIFNIPNL